jgi:hypothetical protein
MKFRFTHGRMRPSASSLILYVLSTDLTCLCHFKEKIDVYLHLEESRVPYNNIPLGLSNSY